MSQYFYTNVFSAFGNLMQPMTVRDKILIAMLSVGIRILTYKITHLIKGLLVNLFSGK